MKTFLMISLALLLAGIGQTAGQQPSYPRYGSVYKQPYGGVTIGQPRYVGGYQTLPGGVKIYTAPVHPVYQGFWGKYSPSPKLPRK